jgi:hypothetical protein
MRALWPPGRLSDKNLKKVTGRGKKARLVVSRSAASNAVSTAYSETITVSARGPRADAGAVVIRRQYVARTYEMDY